MVTLGMHREFYNISFYKIAKISAILLTGLPAEAKMCIVGRDQLLKKNSICMQDMRKCLQSIKLPVTSYNKSETF